MVSDFDSSRHTSWHDVVPSKHGVIVNLKWTKTLQSVKGSTPVPLAALPGLLVCPKRVWEEYTAELSEVSGSPGNTSLVDHGGAKGRSDLGITV